MNRLQEFYLAQLDARRRAQRIGRWIVVIGAAFTVLAIVLCGGLMPALFSNPAGLGVHNASASLGCARLRENGGNIPAISNKNLTKEQTGNAVVIIDVGKEINAPPRAWAIAVATAMQESNLHNLPHLGLRNDHDSVGLFQQRPSQGWGSEAQIMDPRYSTKKFYEKLLAVSGWEKMRLTQAAQTVQRSAFPDAYQKWESLAIQVVNDLTKGEAYSGLQDQPMCAEPGVVSASGWVAPTLGTLGSGFRTPSRPQHNGVDIIAARSTTIRAVASGVVIAALCNASTGNCDVDGSPQVTGCGWYVDIDHGNGVMTRYCHMMRKPQVVVGQRVTAGLLLGEVGSSGNSSGAHLHFEVHVNGKPLNPEPFMAKNGAPLRKISP